MARWPVRTIVSVKSQSIGRRANVCRLPGRVAGGGPWVTCEAALAGVAMDEAKMRRPQWPPSPPWGVVKRLGARAGVGDLM